MVQTGRRVLVGTAVLVALALLAALVLPQLVRPRKKRPEGTWRSTWEGRLRAADFVQLAVDQYALDHDRVYPHAPGGSDEALELVVEHLRALGESEDFVRLYFTPPELEAIREGRARFAYLYLNPEPGTNLAPDTVMIVEGGFYYGRHTLFAATVRGRVHVVVDFPGEPKDLLGARISQLYGEKMVEKTILRPVSTTPFER